MRTARAFTLVEVLTTLAVLAIGLSAVVAIVMGSGQMSATARNRNIAAMIIPEAVADIERLHFIASPTLGSLTVPTGDVGYFIETHNTTPADGLNPITHLPWPSIEASPYTGLRVYGSNTLADYRRVAGLGTQMIWPPSPDPKFYGGMRNKDIANGTAFRVFYCLERHPDWRTSVRPPITQSSMEGIYVLTLAAYRDMTPKAPAANADHKYEQISDPVVVYLRARN